MTTAITLSAIVLLFAIFGTVLAWGERQTRHLAKDAPGRKPERPAAQRPLKVVSTAANAAQSNDNERARAAEGN
jgi:hypothetical protein